MGGLLDLVTGGGGGLYAALAALIAIIGGLFTAYIKGGAARTRKHKLKDAEADLKAHGRMNDAETGAGMSDEQRAEWLSRFGNQRDR